MIVGVHPAAQPYFFPGRDVGCLLIHGFTGSPPELLPLAKYLANQGYAVMAPLLAGHGTRVEDLARTNWKDWLQSASAGLSRLQEEPIDRIFIVGLSMGGLLSLMLATGQEAAVESTQNGPRLPVVGVVTINSPIFLKSFRARFSFLLRWFISYTSKESNVVPQDIADTLRFAYSEMPVTGVANLMRLIKAVRNFLPQVKVPAMIVQSNADETVRPVSGEYIYKNIGSQDKRLLWLNDAPHLFTLGLERERVFKEILEFIKNNKILL